MLVAVLFAAAAGCSFWVDGDRYRNHGPEPDGGPTSGSEGDAAPPAPMADASMDAAPPPIDAAPPSCNNECDEDSCEPETCMDPSHDCRLECNPRDCACALDCTASEDRCQAICVGATCEIDCRGVDRCEPRCQRGSQCEIQCSGALDCSRAQCTGGAECLLDCRFSWQCGWDRCEGTETRCANGLIACNRDCP